MLAEVELGSEGEAFAKPDFLGLEVTGDRHFYNSQMRRNPFKLLVRYRTRRIPIMRAIVEPKESAKKSSHSPLRLPFVQ